MHQILGGGASQIVAHSSKKVPNLVAHRGYALAYPENSLSGFNASVASGCRYLELDVQLSKDKVPIVIHDDNLMRTGAKEIKIFENDWQQLKQESVGEPEKYGDRFSDEKILSLADFSGWLQQYPEVKVFVEVKEESINYFGNEVVLKKVVEAIESIKSQCYLISFDAPFLFYAKQKTDFPIGYVLHKYDEPSRQVARQMQPEILICNYSKIPDQENALWLDSWDWFLYEICDPLLAQKWLERGVKYIETMDIKPMVEAFTRDD